MDTGYFTSMPRKARRPKARPSGDEWFVYMVRCADGSLYTGIAKDVARRCKQHNDGTAARYTRSRLPVELVYYEAHPSQSSALKREAAVKAMDRREKLAMAQRRNKPAKGVRQVARLTLLASPFRPGRSGRRRPASVSVSGRLHAAPGVNPGVSSHGDKHSSTF